MKSLVESIFGGNISNNPNITDMQTAFDHVVNMLEKELNMKCIDGMIMSHDTVNKIWGGDNKWRLVKVYTRIKNDGLSMFTVYLQFNKKIGLDGVWANTDTVICPRIYIKVSRIGFLTCLMVLSLICLVC